MKKSIILTVLVLLLSATAVFAQANSDADDGQFHIKGNVDFYVSSSSGGGSDIINTYTHRYCISQQLCRCSVHCLQSA